MRHSQHPLGVASFTFAIINTLMIIFMSLPCMEFSVLGVLCAFIAFLGYEKYTVGLAISGFIFSLLEFVLCLFLGMDTSMNQVSIIASFF